MMMKRNLTSSMSPMETLSFTMETAHPCGGFSFTFTSFDDVSVLMVSACLLTTSALSSSPQVTCTVGMNEEKNFKSISNVMEMLKYKIKYKYNIRREKEFYSDVTKTFILLIFIYTKSLQNCLIYLMT